MASTIYRVIAWYWVPLLYDELQDGRARFGWSGKDEQDLLAIKDKLERGDELTPDEYDSWSRAKFLLDAERGDYIVYPNIPEWDICSIVRITGEYEYTDTWDPRGRSNYRHAISCEYLIEFDRNSGSIPPNLQNQMKLPRSSAQIRDEVARHAILELVGEVDTQSYYAFVAGDFGELEAHDYLATRLEQGIWSLGANTPHRKKLKPGDCVVFYISGSSGQHFAASAVVDSRAFELDEKEQQVYDHDKLSPPTPYAVYLSDVHMWDEPRPIRELADDLEFVKKPGIFGSYLQGGARQISRLDYELITGENGHARKAEYLFRRFFPSMSSEAFMLYERSYKLEGCRKAQEVLNKQRFDTLIAKDKLEELAADVLRTLGATNLLSMYDNMRMRDLPDQHEFVRRTRDVLFATSDEELKNAIDSWNAFVMEGGASKSNAWNAISALLFWLYPDRHIHVKPRYFKKFYDRMGRPCPKQVELSGENYLDVMADVRQLMDLLGDTTLRPRDMIDMHSLVYIAGGGYPYEPAYWALEVPHSQFAGHEPHEELVVGVADPERAVEVAAKLGGDSRVVVVSETQELLGTARVMRADAVSESPLVSVGVRWTYLPERSQSVVDVLDLHVEEQLEPTVMKLFPEGFEAARNLSEIAFTERGQEPGAANVAQLATLEEIIERFEDSPYIFSRETLIDFHNCLHAQAKKHFVILSGLSGTGKTLLVRAYANALYGYDLDCRENGYLKIVPVRPNWTDSTDLLGYWNSLHNSYERTGLLDFLLEAAESESPYILCLDEMNLAHPEHYFAEFLSAMETGSPIPLHDQPDAEVPHSLDLVRENEDGPLSNLLIVGTVNIDETTKQFSPKVLDRAYTIELEDVDIPLFTKRYLENGEFDQGLVELVARTSRLLQQISEPLRPHQLHFGYRTCKEIFDYMALNHRSDVALAEGRALDNMLMRKILPKFKGTQVIEPALREVRAAFRDALREVDEDAVEHSATLDRLDKMLEELNLLGVTQFWR